MQKTVCNVSIFYRLDHIQTIEVGWGVLANKPECKCFIYSSSFSIKITQLKYNNY